MVVGCRCNLVVDQVSEQRGRSYVAEVEAGGHSIYECNVYAYMNTYLDMYEYLHVFNISISDLLIGLDSVFGGNKTVREEIQCYTDL